MVASTEIKFYVSSNANAPQLNNVQGGIIDVLDACLVNGLQLGTVSSLVASGTTVTATFGAAHNLLQYQVLQISGAIQPEYNGQHRILTVPSATTLTFELASVPAVSPATGTISASLPPLGWTKPFSATGKAAYLQAYNPNGDKPYLRVVDELDPVWTSTYAKYAKVGICEGMTDIDTWTAEAPYDSSAPTKNWVGTGSGSSAYNGWAKWYYARTTTPHYTSGTGSDATTPTTGARPWIIVGDGKRFYILNSWYAGFRSRSVYGFGSYDAVDGSDNFNNFLLSHLGYRTASTGWSPADNNTFGLNNNSNSNPVVFQRSHDGVTNYATGMLLYPCYSSTSSYFYSGQSNYITAAATSQKVSSMPVGLVSGTYRGDVPLLRVIPQVTPYADYEALNDGTSMFVHSYIAGFNNQGTTSEQLGGILIYLGEL